MTQYICSRLRGKLNCYAYDWLVVAGGGPGLGKAKHSAPLLVFANTSRITQH